MQFLEDPILELEGLKDGKDALLSASSPQGIWIRPSPHKRRLRMTVEEALNLLVNA